MRPIFHAMNTKRITYAGALAALYVVLTYAQNWIFPGSTSMAIQMRLSEALCVLAFFTPAAIPGLTVGCLLYNLSWAQALPFDFLVGSLATLFATLCMWKLRRVRLFRLPLPGLLCRPFSRAAGGMGAGVLPGRKRLHRAPVPAQRPLRLPR